MTIGQRAAEAIREKAKFKGLDFRTECSNIGVPAQTVSCWKVGHCDPGSFYLAEMYKLGYDVIYILTGENGINTGGDLCV